MVIPRPTRLQEMFILAYVGMSVYESRGSSTLLRNKINNGVDGRCLIDLRVIARLLVLFDGSF